MRGIALQPRRDRAGGSLALPEAYPALLGTVPLALRLHKLRGLRRVEGDADPEGRAAQAAEARAERRSRSQVLAVAGVTVANRGDNLGVYIPLFAREPRFVRLYAVVFAAMTALRCFVGHRLAQNCVVGAQIRRFGHVALPLVLITLGVWILAGASVLLP